MITRMIQRMCGMNAQRYPLRMTPLKSAKTPGQRWYGSDRILAYMTL